MENNPLRGRGLGKLGWTEGGKIHSSNKRLLGTFENQPKSKDKSKQVKAVCDKCGSVFSIRGEKSPSHKHTYKTYEIVDDKAVYYDVTEECNGKLLVGGKEKLAEHKFSFTRRKGPYSAEIVDCVIKPGDTVIAEVNQYVDGKLQTVVIEKTIKSIIRAVSINYSWYSNKSKPNTTTTIYCTDSSVFPMSVKDIVII